MGTMSDQSKVAIDTDDALSAVEVDHSPTRVSSYVAIAAGIVAALLSAPFALLALPVGIGGVGILAMGLLRGGNRMWVTMGTAGLFLSVLIAGGFGTSPVFLLLSAAATLFAWNAGLNAIGLGEQIGRHSETRRNEIIHLSAAAIVAAVAVAFSFIVYTVAGGGRPVAALTLLLFGAVFLAWAIRT